jgi:transposase
MGKRYAEEFKEEAVRLVLSGEGSMAQIARDLDVNANTLSAWTKEYCRKHPDESGRRR